MTPTNLNGPVCVPARGKPDMSLWMALFCFLLTGVGMPILLAVKHQDSPLVYFMAGVNFTLYGRYLIVRRLP
jgi:branched-subunit amino acid permease